MEALKNRIPKQYRDTVDVQELPSGNVLVQCTICRQEWQPNLQAHGHLPRGWYKCPNPHLTKYHLRGKVIVTQFCRVDYPEKTGLPTLTLCPSREDCGGHEISFNYSEVVEARSPDEAVDVSLSSFERLGNANAFGDGLEPTWLTMIDTKLEH